MILPFLWPPRFSASKDLFQQPGILYATYLLTCRYCQSIPTVPFDLKDHAQHVDVPEVVDCLHRALKRGVDVVLLMPGEPAVGSNILPECRAFLSTREEVLAFENFILAGIAGIGNDGRRKPIYFHAKIMLIDDEWARVGSCNLHHFSLFGNSEMNAAFSEPNTVRAFRCELLHEHLDQDTSLINDREALHLFRKIARENRMKRETGDHAWQGLAFELNLAKHAG